MKFITGITNKIIIIMICRVPKNFDSIGRLNNIFLVPM